jgi:hypothetical protein
VPGPSIPEIERQMMFLNEPTIQKWEGGQDIVKHILKVHQRCMNFEYSAQKLPQAEIEKSFSDAFPMDYDHFKGKCLKRLSSIEETLTLVKAKMKDVDDLGSSLVNKVEAEKEQLKVLLQDVTTLFSICIQRVKQVEEMQS